MAQYGMVIDVTRCTACYCCFAACKDEYWENDYPPYSAAQPRYGQFWMNLLKSERGQYPHVSVTYMPMPCWQMRKIQPAAAADSKGSSKRQRNGVDH
jgi:Fe-S-cluster-containing dehydrogenase component